MHFFACAYMRTAVSYAFRASCLWLPCLQRCTFLDKTNITWFGLPFLKINFVILKFTKRLLFSFHSQRSENSSKSIETENGKNLQITPPEWFLFQIFKPFPLCQMFYTSRNIEWWNKLLHTSILSILSRMKSWLSG